MRTVDCFLWAAIALALGACGGSGGGSKHPSSIASIASSLSSIQSSTEVSSASVTTSSSASSATMAAVVSGFIVVDQFGYKPAAKKVAIIRDPQIGYDADQSFTPGSSYQLVNLDTGTVVLSDTAKSWGNGGTSDVSGDKVWRFDFSSVQTPGSYAVVDVQRNLRSPSFKIAGDVYKPVLKHAVRTFFYQRAGFAKQQPFAEAGWEDAASHLGPCQDANARLFTAQADASTERDLSGGWFDAGDYNKYTNWHADYLITLLHAYLENPAAWTDDFNIPESGNGLPDLVDEIIWGFDWLKKMQNNDGSMLSIQGLAHASPPSAATGCSYYGPANTSATLTSAAAFAFGSKVLASLGNDSLTTYAADLKSRAGNAWSWAIANPSVVVHNNQGALSGLGAGDQEVDDKGRADKKIKAAIYLFAATNDATYRTIVDASLGSMPWVTPWEEPQLTSWLYYASLPEASANVATSVKSKYLTAMNDSSNWAAVTGDADAYHVPLGASNFTWGSNRTMSRKGLTYVNLNTYGVGSYAGNAVENAALDYLHYLHGANPLGMVYLSNMYSLGVHNSVNEFYHSWFADKSANWDRVGQSSYGPAPGFLVGGPNPSYDWDSCCPSSCGSAANNNVCTSISLTPPKGQPAMKSYLDFNTSWPLNSWQITENHNDYQVAYIRLLSKFVGN